MTKPSKPTPDFPLFPHASGQWAKKVNGRMHYLGPWSDPGKAPARYLGRMSNSKRIASPAKPAKLPKPRRGHTLYARASGQGANGC